MVSLLLPVACFHPLHCHPSRFLSALGPCISSPFHWDNHYISALPVHVVILPSRGIGPTSNHVLFSSKFSQSWLWPACHGRSGRGDTCQCVLVFCILLFSVFLFHLSSLGRLGMGVSVFFCFLRKSSVEEVQKHLNRVSQAIQFTVEQETENKLPFLDTASLYGGGGGLSKLTVY